jgi:N utilization substance protein A
MRSEPASGMKGMRVQSIIRELRGEKIDIIEYHEDPVTFAEKALQPAKVSRVTVVDAADKHLEVVVDDTQLSLAIGKKGAERPARGQAPGLEN